MFDGLQEEHLTELINLSNEEFSRSNKKHEERLGVVDKEIEQWQGRLDRLYEFVETRSIEPDRMATRIAEVQDKIEQLRQTKLEIEEDHLKWRARVIDTTKVLAYVSELREFVDSRGLFERKSFLRSIIRSIEADDDKMIFNYSLPLLPDDTTREVVSVLDIVPSAPPIFIAKLTSYDKILQLT